MRVRGRNIDDVDVGVLRQLFVGAVGLRSALGYSTCVEKLLSAVFGAAGSGSDDFMSYIGNAAGGRVDEKILGES